MSGENDGGKRNRAIYEDPGIRPRCNRLSQGGPVLDLGCCQEVIGGKSIMSRACPDWPGWRIKLGLS